MIAFALLRISTLEIVEVSSLLVILLLSSFSSRLRFSSTTKDLSQVTTEVGLGTYSSVIYEESDSIEYEKKCIELLTIKFIL